MKQLDAKTIESLDKQIKSGDISSVQAFLEDFDPNVLKRDQLSQIANIARRVGFHRYALKLLFDIVRADKGMEIVANPEEKLEYAAALIRARAFNEAKTLLEQLDPQKYPQSLFQQSILKIQTWNYVEAIPLLEKYVAMVVKSSYEYFVGCVNLAESYHYAFRDVDCLSLVDRLIAEVKESKYTLLYGNLLEIKGRALLGLNKFKEARVEVAKARALIGDGHYRYSFYLDQLSAQIEVTESPIEENIEKLRNIRAKAHKHRLWEMVRECDLILALAENDKEKIAQIYVGSQHEMFRQRIMKLVGEQFELPEYVDFQIGSGDSQGILDLDNGTLLATEASLNKGTVVHKLLQILLADRYHNYRTETLFPLLYPGEFFDPVHFHNRIHNVMARLRRWFKEANIPIEIRESHEEYEVVALKPITIRVAVQTVLRDSSDHLIKKIQEEFGDKEFSSQEVAQVISISLSSSKRILNEAVERAILVRTGKSRSTRYRFAA
jgi:hypothetical protein